MPAPAAAATTAMSTMKAAMRFHIDVGGGGGAGIHAGGGVKASGADRGCEAGGGCWAGAAVAGSVGGGGVASEITSITASAARPAATGMASVSAPSPGRAPVLCAEFL